MSVQKGHDPSDESGKRQLQIWDEELEAEVGKLEDGDMVWRLHVVIEPTADLYRGRLSFRRQEERYDTAEILVEETKEAVIERAGKLPESLLAQLLQSARG